MGCGFLGGIVADAYAKGLLPDYELLGVASRTMASAQALAERTGCRAAKDIDELLAMKPDIVVETASVECVRAIAEPVLRAGCDLVVISIGAFADAAFYERVKTAARESGARVHVSHIQNAFECKIESDAMARAGVEQTLALLEDYRKRGLEVGWDVIPRHAFGPFHYPMAASMFQPYVEQCGGVQRFSQLLRTGNYRDILEAEIRSGNHASRGIFTRFNPCTNPAWDTAQRFSKTKDASLTGKTIREAANGRDSLSFLLDLLSEDPYACVISLNRRPEHTPDRDAFVDCGDACIGLDTWSFDYAAALSEGDLPLECGSPATYCGMTRFLEDQRAQRPIGEIVRRLTGNAAERLHLRDRGYIREGDRADVLLLDPTRFKSNENLSDPRCGASGLDCVIVNGEIAVRNGAHTHVRSGEIL